MNKKTFTFLTLLLYLLLKSNFIYAQDNFIDVIDNKSIKFSKEGQEKLNRVKNQKLYQEPQIVQFRDIEKVIKEKNLEFVLPNYSCKLSFTYQNGEYEDSNNYHWYGTLFNEKQKNCYDGTILFVKKDGEIFGTIDIDESSYEFMEIENGYQVLYKINPEIHGVCGNSKDTNPIKNNTKKEEILDQNTLQRIECVELTKLRILVLYTPAANSEANVSATTTLGIQQIKTALTNSQVSKSDLDIELAGLLPFNFVESSIFRDIDSLKLNSTAQSLRSQYKADAVVLLTKGYGGSATGIVAGGVVNTLSENAYAIVEAKIAVSQKTFAHEVGHLLGARHNDEGVGTIEHGYIFRPGIWPFAANQFTIMTTDLRDSQKERRLLNYSNPNVNYNGHATGTVSSNNVAKHFKTTGKIVANHFPNTSGVYSVYMEGDNHPCPGVRNLYEAKINCGKAPFTIQWHTSTDGVNWTLKKTGEHFIFYPPIEIVSNTSIRMTVTDGNGAKQLHYIHTNSDPNRSPCTNNPLHRSENTIGVIAKVSPNPIEGKAQLYVELPKEDTQTQILIVDSFGKTIQTLDTSKFTQKAEFDITGLSTGLYYISIRSPKNGLHSITIHVK